MVEFLLYDNIIFSDSDLPPDISLLCGLEGV